MRGGRKDDTTTDYLVVGAGAMGMAFTDVVLTETDARVAVIDRHDRPGGHWNDAYPFVRLHQPSSFYGVNSTALGAGVVDVAGWNRGLYELASGTEVVSYFDRVMHQRFIPSGRVTYLPMHDHRGEGRAVSLVTGDERRIEASTVVDTTYMNVTVPSTTPPTYAVDDGVTLRSPNDLPRSPAPADGRTVIGGGKTAMDACLWLLAKGVDPAAIRWIRPRDAWLLDRAHIQPGELAADTLAAFARQTDHLAEATSVEDAFRRMEDCGVLLRIDPEVRPTMYRCATVTVAELEQLRRISDVVRLGRVERLGEHEIELERGTVPTTPGTLHIDCTADGLARRPARPIFEPGSITLQPVRTCQQVFSAALIAHVEAAYDDLSTKNELCVPVPHPDDDIDFLRTALISTANGMRWRQDPELRAWLDRSRLNGFARPSDLAGVTPEVVKNLKRLWAATPLSVENLGLLLADEA